MTGWVGEGVFLQKFCPPWTEVSHCIQPDLVARSRAAHVPAHIAQCGRYSQGGKALFSSESY